MQNKDHLLALEAPAKINLYLCVTGRRADGYHLLDSLVTFTKLGDRLIAEPADRLTLRIEGPFSGNLKGCEEDNIVLRAARALQGAFGIREGATVTLEKNLPISSGIGGGSADAAAALRILTKLWRIKTNDAELSRIGLLIGADIPVCIAGVTCHMSGMGETVLPADPLPTCGIVIVNGAEAVSTPAVFAGRKGPYTTCMAWEAPINFDEFVSQLQLLANDLMDSARTVSPLIADVLGELKKAEGCALARMSGSGGTCFGLFADQSGAEKAAGDIRNANPQWWSMATTFRTKRPKIC
ncbi:MAG: 4-(cytidine 5'-diphospho)-2-C-methyl-D-erythritol kinase [Pseudomonadota bacterium]|nr:4-(cytidine 5'-diphospho)-2-C-methyl-D-erythritol kinase [Pseudomonadota bacterium]